MVFDFYPWVLDVDVEATRKLYKEKDFSIDKDASLEFVSRLSDKEKEFFDSLGVIPEKVKADKKVYEIPADEDTCGGKIYRMAVDFLFCGNILAIPEFQKDLYSSEELFGETLPETLTVHGLPEEEYLTAYQVGDLGKGIVFKHPCTRYEEEKFQVWDCGYIVGSLLIFQDL